MRGDQTRNYTGIVDGKLLVVMKVCYRNEIKIRRSRIKAKFKSMTILCN